MWPALLLDKLRSDPVTSGALVVAGIAFGWGAAWFLSRRELSIYRASIEHLQGILTDRLPTNTYRSLRFRKGRSMVVGFGLLVGGLVFASAGAATLLWNAWNAAPTNTTSSTAVTVPALETARSPSEPPAQRIQWNQIFGTTRSMDLMIALLLDGRGPDSKSVKLKSAFLQSGITGEIITMKIGSEDPTQEPFPISEANPIPPKGFIRLIAFMNPLSPNSGLPNKKFLDGWRKTWFHATYEDAPPDDILFDESVMGSYFPELAGPHVTRRSP